MTQQARVPSWGNILGKGDGMGSESGVIDARHEKDREWVELPQTKSIIVAVIPRIQARQPRLEVKKGY